MTNYMTGLEVVLADGGRRMSVGERSICPGSTSWGSLRGLRERWAW